MTNCNLFFKVVFSYDVNFTLIRSFFSFFVTIYIFYGGGGRILCKYVITTEQPFLTILSEKRCFQKEKERVEKILKTLAKCHTDSNLRTLAQGMKKTNKNFNRFIKYIFISIR